VATLTRWAFRIEHPDRDTHVGVSEPYRDCLRDALASVRDVNTWLDRSGWLPMAVTARAVTWPCDALLHCCQASTAHDSCTARKGSLTIHRTHYRLAEASAQALGPFWMAYDYWSQQHGSPACDCEDCTELDAHWRDVEAHLQRHDAYCRRHWQRLGEVSHSLVKPEHIF